MKFLTLVPSLLALASLAQAADFHKVELTSEDDLPVTGDLYLAHENPKTPFIVLFHQAGWSRGEYREIAPRLNELGFNCLAVDQRSGGAVNDVPNETAARAKQAGKELEYVDALPDMLAAIRYAREEHAQGKLVIWGSSYSAALVLKIAGDEPELVDGVLAFAPGEYFESPSRPADWIRMSAKKIMVPAFVTSAKKEKTAWWSIYEAIPSKTKAYFLPESNGKHGSSALWKEFEGNGVYWTAVTTFLDKNFPRTAVAAQAIEAGKKMSDD